MKNLFYYCIWSLDVDDDEISIALQIHNRCPNKYKKAQAC